MKPSDMLFCAEFASGRLRQYGYIDEANRLDRVITQYNQGAATYELLSDATVDGWIVAKVHESISLYEDAA